MGAGSGTVVSRTHIDRPGSATGGNLKRVTDVTVATIALLALSPLLILIALFLTASGNGSAVLAQRRIGLHGHHFECFKFRTMVADAEEVLKRYLATNPVARAEWDSERKLRNDPRVTAIGKVLRMTSLDELPQLVNVLRGEMSLIGPRPIFDDEVARFGRQYLIYQLARPGMTGLWQVSGRSNTSYATRVQLDTEYVVAWTFALDLQIAWRTIGAVLSMRGSC